jgi:hypothetical protein
VCGSKGNWSLVDNDRTLVSSGTVEGSVRSVYIFLEFLRLSGFLVAIRILVAAGVAATSVVGSKPEAVTVGPGASHSEGATPKQCLVTVRPEMLRGLRGTRGVLDLVCSTRGTWVHSKP